MVVEQLVQPRQGFAGLADETFTEGGDLHMAGAAVEQRLAELVLQVLDGARHRLRRGAQARGGLAEARGFGGNAQNPQQFDAIEHGFSSIKWNF
ncbi:hypothetical protein FQZ97_1192510 [compost metagenome]